MNFHGVDTGLEALKLTDDGSEIVRLLDKLDAALRVRVAKEIKRAGGHDLLVCLRLVLPVGIDGCSIESNDIAGSDSRSALPLNTLILLGALGLTTAIVALALLLVLRLALLIALLLVVSATTNKTILRKSWGTIARLRLAISLLLLGWSILLLLSIR